MQRNKVHTVMFTCFELPRDFHFSIYKKKKYCRNFTSWKSSCAPRGWMTEGLMSILHIPQQWFPDIRVLYSPVILLVMRSEAPFTNRESGVQHHIQYCEPESLRSVSEVFGTYLNKYLKWFRNIWIYLLKCTSWDIICISFF